MSAFKVTTSQLTTQATELSELNGRFKTAVEQLVSSEGNLKSMWEGEANEAFHMAFTNDKVKMDDFYNTIATRYNQTEQANTQIASNRSY